jgi:type IV pilus assembly protein PilY1
MNIIRLTFLLAFGVLAPWRPTLAEDIELFVRADPASNAPNVLFVIDNAANFSSNNEGFECRIDGVRTKLWDKVGGIEQCALHKVISDLELDSVNIGVMVYNATGVVDWGGGDCFKTKGVNQGGCLVVPIVPLNAENKAKLLAWIKNWKINERDPGFQIKGDGKATGASMQEAWAYLDGRMGLSGFPYGESLLDTACNTYIIFVGNSYDSSGKPGDQPKEKGPQYPLEGLMKGADIEMNASPAATAEEKLIINKTFSTSCGSATLGITNHNNNGYYADEWARYLNGRGVTTYTIGVLGDKCQADYAAVLTSMADVGGGKYFPTRNFDELVTAVKTALSEMLSVNSVFASVSLPISVNTEGTYLNQVYIGMFRPDKDTLPRWVGNLKQYRLGRVDGALKLLDAKDVPEPAISSAGTGFVSACALSYWTKPDTYWANFVERNCETADARSNAPDGPVVEKGAQGYTLRGMTVAGRNLKTCGNAACTSITNFETGNAAVTKTLLGDAAMSDAERAVLINWARGLNNRGTATARAVYPDEEPDESFVLATAMRPSVHGDVVHSRPVAISYADKVVVAAGEDPPPDEPKVVVFYGGNDGVLRAINGNRTDAIGGVAAGRELWSFMAPEFMKHVKRLRDNAPNILVKGLEDGVRARKPYGFDGPVTAHSEGDDRWIFPTMRRGGRMVYAFDVKSIADDPDSPEIMWRLGCPNPKDDVGCTVAAADGVAGGSGLGQTWSAPKVLKTSGYKDGASFKPMLIMGGGYDECEDTDPARL